jgi:cytochrome c-type biogenesis protein CcsB
MTNINFEILLGNLSFILLFGIMIFYWLEVNFSFFLQFHFIAFSTTILANVILLMLLIIRWVNYGHFPLSNMFESLIFLSWSLTLLQLILEKLSKNNFLGAILSPIALFTNSFASFSLPLEMQKASVLVPALQSNWLMMHVTVMMLSYAALLGGSLLAIAFLIITFGKNIDLTGNSLGLISNNGSTNKELPVDFLTLEPPSQLLQYETGNTKQFVVSISSNQQESFINQQSLVLSSISTLELNKKNDFLINQTINYKLAKTLDNLSYRTLGIGFPLLTIGILSGAVWANEAWGSYWSWDPKETWALITWIVFAVYLHTRITKGWQGKRPAIIASAGFFIVWICYLGVNLLGKGLHSYGWVHLNI